MGTILITGATGNVGLEVIKKLIEKNSNHKVLAGVIDKPARKSIIEKFDIATIFFDFTNLQSVTEALTLCDVLFLLRPPQLADVKKYFAPIIHTAVEKKISHIVFLSLQGAESSRLIPHHKIEKLIIDSGINYTFLRPAYFMQNFTTTLRKELVEKNQIFLPAGNAKFTLIDVEDIGTVAAEILTNCGLHQNKAYDLTNYESLNFSEMAEIIGQELNKPIRFVSPSLFSFFIAKRREGFHPVFIFVMIMLHYFPRFKPAPNTSDGVEKITGLKPKTFREFVIANNGHLL